MTYRETKADVVKELLEMGLLPVGDGSYYVPGYYELRHGEYERPDYTPSRYKDGWSVRASYYYYSGTYDAEEDGRINLEAIIYNG